MSRSKAVAQSEPPPPPPPPPPASAPQSDAQPHASASVAAPPLASRLCVKNLPPYVTEAELRKLFSAEAPVTDCKVLRTPDNRTRQFGFVGFASDDDARRACARLHRTFIGSMRITVEPARPVNSAEAPRPWSRHSIGVKVLGRGKPHAAKDAAPLDTSSLRASDMRRLQQARRRAAVERLPPSVRVQARAIDDDEAFAQFLAVIGKAHVWENDMAPLPTAKPPAVASAQEVSDFVGDSAAPSADAGAASSSSAATASAVAAFAAAPAGAPTARKALDAVVHSEAVSDLEYLRSRMRKPAADAARQRELALRAEEGGSGSGGSASGSANGRVTRRVAKDDSSSSGTSSSSSSSSNSSNSSNSNSSNSNSSSSSSSSSSRHSNKQEISQGNPQAAAHPHEKQAVAESQEATSSRAPVPDSEADADAGISGRLFVRNLSFDVTEDDLQAAFGVFGKIAEIHVPLTREHKSRGIAFVLYVFPEHAVRALEAMDGAIFQGRLLHVLPARLPTEHDAATDAIAGANGAGASSAYKTERDRKLKAKAGSAHNWNALYMRPDTVAAAMADQLGVAKGELLDAEAESMAVRLALGEAHVIAETKKQLREQGVNLDVLEAAAAGGREWSKAARSTTVILAKNLPFSTSEAELRELFSRFGALLRVVLPPTRTVALIEYAHANHAKAAFSRLAYSKFKAVPLYLEMAPRDVFNDGLRVSGAAAAGPDAEPVPQTPGAAGGSGASETAAALSRTLAQSAAGPTANRTVYVSNLAFETTDAGLAEHMAAAGVVRSAKVARRLDVRRGLLSLGYGFVEYDSAEGALEALKTLQSAVLDGHALRLQFAKPTVDSGAAEGAASRKRTHGEAEQVHSAANAKNTKLTIRNVAFEATKKDLRSLCAPFGQVKSVRLPRKPDGSTRGFAFVDFLTHQEALNAFDALQAAHLYGRHLVIEWASGEDDSLAAVRDKTMRYYQQLQGDGTSKKRRLTMHADVADVAGGDSGGDDE